MKNIYLIRHGKATHNYDNKKRGDEAYLDEINADSGLVEEGFQQADELSKNIDKFIKENNIELVITSPLRRCIMTSLIIFRDVDIPIIANDYIREYPPSEHVCNKRMTKENLKWLFPNRIDFSNIEEKDTLWSNDPEKYQNINERIQLFKDFLKTRKEKNIIVISHYTIIYNIINGKNECGKIKHCLPYYCKI